jgi:hypothetical protein
MQNVVKCVVKMTCLWRFVDRKCTYVDDVFRDGVAIRSEVPASDQAARLATLE